MVGQHSERLALGRRNGQERVASVTVRQGGGSITMRPPLRPHRASRRHGQTLRLAAGSAGGMVVGHRVRGIAPRARQEGGITLVQVLVRDNNVDQALKALKKKMQREGVFREMKLRRNFEKPSEKRAREKAEAIRRARKLERKRLEREGF